MKNYDANTQYPINISTGTSRAMNPIHMHSFMQIFCVKSGSCIHDLRGEVYKFYAGEISIAPSFCEHTIDGREDEYELLGMDLYSGFFETSKQSQPWNFYDSCIVPLCDSAARGNHVFRPRNDIRQDVFRLYDEINVLAKENGEEKYPLLRAKTIELISLVATEYSVCEGIVQENRYYGNCAPMHEVFRFIHKNFCGELSVKKTAKEAMISERSLYRLFEENMNMSMHQYIQHLRLRHAKKLLEQTDRTICDIANSSGFEYLANFHRFFREKEGISPGEYRDKIRGYK